MVCTEPDVFVSQFKNGTTALYAIVNRAAAAASLDDYLDQVMHVQDLHLSLPCLNGMRFFDLYHGVEIDPDNHDRCKGCEDDTDNTCEGRVSIAVPIESSGIGAILSLTMDAPGSSRPTDLHDYLDQVQSVENAMGEMAVEIEGPELATLAKTWAPLQQTLTQNEATPIAADLPLGMASIPGGAFDYESTNNCIEGDQLEDAVGVQMPWQIFPQRSHSQRIRMPRFHMDKQLVTNEQYRAFINRGDNQYFQPRDTQNWLKDWPGGMIPDGEANHPVRWVSRTDADQYCRYYGKRLPSTWEWQYAAQGTDGRRYPWGNSWDKRNVSTCSYSRLPNVCTAYERSVSAGWWLLLVVQEGSLRGCLVVAFCRWHCCRTGAPTRLRKTSAPTKALLHHLVSRTWSVIYTNGPTRVVMSTPAAGYCVVGATTTPSVATGTSLSQAV